MKQKYYELLKAIVNTNGGGVDRNRAKKESLKYLYDQGLIKEKNGHADFVIHTKEGFDLIMGRRRSTSLEEYLNSAKEEKKETRSKIDEAINMVNSLIKALEEVIK